MNLTREHETALATQAAQGDEGAFEELRTAFKSSLEGFIRVRANNDDDAQEIAQDTWLRFWKSVKNYDPARAGCLTFLRTIANSALADYYRRNYRPAEILFSELQQRYSESGEEAEIGELLASLAPGAILCAPDATSGLLEDLALRLVFSSSSPPHQLIAFGFAERLGWKPQAIVEELSEDLLRALERTLEEAYVTTSQVSSTVIRARFKPLRECMANRVDSVIKEAKTREVCQEFLECVVGDTVLRQYYTHNPTQEISHWCQAVRRRVVKETTRGTNPLVSKNSRAACDISTAQP
jgi:DNA-directed RNA polymerase specialized sigma24 family protein